jgi:hypothetical protein
MRGFTSEIPGQTEDLPVYFPMTEAREILFRGDIIERRSVIGNHEVVLATKAGLAFIDAGQTPWQLDLTSKTCIVPDSSPDRVVVEATWYSAEEAQAVGLKVVAGGDANIFGGLGALLVPDDFHIPAVEATTDNVKFYGLTLIAEGRPFTIDSADNDLALIAYDYDSRYRDDFLTQTEGGGGYFVERHDFPHLHIPLNDQCGGYIVIGKQMSERQFAFTAFRIPHRHALYTPAHTIHGDGTLVGTHAITVARSSAKADTVLFYNRNTISKADNLVPRWNG